MTVLAHLQKVTGGSLLFTSVKAMSRWLDIEMPGLNSTTITDLIMRKFPEVKVLIQPVFNDNERIFQALCAGALGYILKNNPPGKYPEAIGRCIEGILARFTSWSTN